MVIWEGEFQIAGNNTTKLQNTTDTHKELNIKQVGRWWEKGCVGSKRPIVRGVVDNLNHQVLSRKSLTCFERMHFTILHCRGSGRK